MRFNAERGTLGYGLQSRKNGELHHVHTPVFRKIKAPLYFVADSVPYDIPNAQPDARFYVFQQAPAGYTFRSLCACVMIFFFQLRGNFFSFSLPVLTFRLEIVDGGRACSINREIRFPALGEIVRLQLLRQLRGSRLRQITEDIFEANRYRFLEETFFPEVANQLHSLLTKQKLSAQLPMANKELATRTYPCSDVNIQTSFAGMSGQELNDWLAYGNGLQGELKQTATLDGLPAVLWRKTYVKNKRPLGLGHYERKQSFPFTFVDYSHAGYKKHTDKLVHEAKIIREHPSYLGSKAQLGAMLPFHVFPPVPTYFETDNSGNIKKILNFLSFGTHKFVSPFLPPTSLPPSPNPEEVEDENALTLTT